VADISDLNPAFLPLLNAYTGALDKAGIGYRVDSGYRTPEQQAEIYARSNQGRNFAAAPPWRSFHNYGLAADVIPNNPADYARMHDLARQAGLYDAQQGLGFTNYDPPHIEMPGSLSNLINQYHLAGWRPAGMPAPASGAIAYTGPTGQPSRPGTTAPGTTLNSSPMDIVLNAESGDRNIPNVHQTTSSGQAQGNAQITTGTWTDFAPKAGVDLKQYPTPMDAPRDVQIKVASVIPLNRWASSTVNAVLAKYPGIDTSQPLGVIQSNAINPSGAPAAAPTAPAAVAATPPASGGLAGSLPGFQAGSPGAKMTAAGLQQLAGKGAGGTGGDDAPPFRLQPMPQAQVMGGPMMMGAGGQNAMGGRIGLQDLAQRGFMTQPTLAAFGGGGLQSPVPAAMPGGATGMPATGIAGTTLNSPSQLQMALMTGALSPYDMYARQAGS
jgi:hypothetical protein